MSGDRSEDEYQVPLIQGDAASASSVDFNEKGYSLLSGIEAIDPSSLVESDGVKAVVPREFNLPIGQGLAPGSFFSIPNMTDFASSKQEFEIKDEDETLVDRIFALSDAIPPKLKYLVRKVAWSAYYKITDLSSLLGKTAWIAITASLISVLPVALDLEREQLLIQEEFQIKAHQSGSSDLKKSS